MAVSKSILAELAPTYERGARCCAKTENNRLPCDDCLNTLVDLWAPMMTATPQPSALASNIVAPLLAVLGPTRANDALLELAATRVPLQGLALPDLIPQGVPGLLPLGYMPEWPQTGQALHEQGLPLVAIDRARRYFVAWMRAREVTCADWPEFFGAWMTRQWAEAQEDTTELVRTFNPQPKRSKFWGRGNG